MKKTKLWMPAAILTLCGAQLLSSCSNIDKPSSSSPGAEAEKGQLVGNWYIEYESTGSIGTSDASSEKIAYTRILEYYRFNGDQTGMWGRYYLKDADPYPVQEWGGTGAGDFTYTIDEEGNLSIRFTDLYTREFPDQRTAVFADGTLTDKSDTGEQLTYKPADETVTASINEWDGLYHIAGDDQGDSQGGSQGDSQQTSGSVGVRDSYRIFGVGYGYNFMLDNANATSAAPILNPKYIVTNDFRHSGGINATYSDNTYTGHSLSEVANNFSASASVGGGLFGFNGEVGAAFNSNKTQSSEHEYAMTIIDATLTNVVLETEMADILKNLLPTFRAALEGKRDWYTGDKGIKHLIDDYGTHFVTRTEIGGRVRYANIVDLSKVTGSFDLNAYAKMSYNKLGFSASASVSNDYKTSFNNNTSAVTTKITVLGGSPSAVTTLATSPTKENLANWALTLSEDDYKNTVVTKVLQCTPIWELLPAKFADRAKKIKDYICDGQYEQDMKSVYNYQVGNMGEIKDVTAIFSAADEKSGTLVKDLKIDGITVARACKEFIPELSTQELSIVLYPVVNNRPKYNLGYFIGNMGRRPCRICWSDTSAVVKQIELSREKSTGQKKHIYILGCSFLNEEIDQKTIKAGVPRDVTAVGAYLQAQACNAKLTNSDYNYPLVKLFNRVWTRENFKYWINIENKAVCAFNTNEVYYNTNMVKENGARQELPSGWRLPTSKDFENLKLELQNNSIPRPARALANDGVTRFNAVWTGYIDNKTVKESNVNTHFVASAYDEKTKRPAFNKAYTMKLSYGNGNLQVYEETGEHYHSVRLVEDIPW